MKPADTSVMILAAGRGKRMMPLTSKHPKPLLKVGEHSLLERHLIKLQRSGFQRVVINLDYLGEQIREAYGDGEQYDLQIQYSDESQTGALETAGGIINALSKIDSDPFLVINGDIVTDIEFTSLLTPLRGQACLILVDNPAHNPQGDFALDDDQYLVANDTKLPKLTFSGVGLYHKSLFSELPSGPRALAPLLRTAISNHAVEGIHFKGAWFDIGTPERLDEINRHWPKSAI